jgi:hypothetical protein
MLALLSFADLYVAEMLDPGSCNSFRFQECIKPVKIERKSGKLSSIKVTSSGDYSEVDAQGVETKLAKAQITLNDCLACSGCVTSAETVLIQLQSAEELYRILEENTKVLYASCLLLRSFD